MTDANTPLTVYFDGSCPLCLREISFYQGRRGAEQIAWVNLADTEQNTDLGPGLTCQTAMARFHIRDQDGRLLSGGKAFARLWVELPSFRWLGKIGLWPPVCGFLDWAYDRFLPLRPRIQRLLTKPTNR